MANNRARSGASPSSRSAPGKLSTGAASAAGQPGSPGDPRPPASSVPTPARAALVRFSHPLLVRMAALPRFIVPAVLAAALFFGLVLTSPWAGLLLIGIAVFLGWLTALSWPAISPASRALRVMVNVAILGLGLMRVLGRA